MLKHFMYLDSTALSDYLSALEGGFRAKIDRRHQPLAGEKEP